jgi:RimJ/RimL family protein N-acetyltransferase
MKRIITGLPVARYVATRVGKTITPPYEAMGVEINGQIAGGVVFNSFTGEDVEVTVAGEPAAWTPALVRRLSRYAFDELGVLRVSMTTQNPAVVDFAQRLGAKLEGVKRNHFGPGKHGYLFGVLREEWSLMR